MPPSPDPIAPPHAVSLFKSDRGRETWLIHKPDSPPTVLKTQTATPLYILKHLLRVSQLHRQARGITILKKYNLPTAAHLGPPRLKRIHNRYAITLELELAPGNTLYNLLNREHPTLEDQRQTAIQVGSLIAQTTAAGLFNDDFKGDNLIVDLATHPPRVTLIDTVAITSLRTDPHLAVVAMSHKLWLSLVEFGQAPAATLWRTTLRQALRPFNRAQRARAIQALRQMPPPRTQPRLPVS
ncbi:MAG: hypothetical protein GC164_13335 [Phycisphaera sp.]|nr:hypothetical protein [Phycisphaera sp.]